MLCYQIGVAQLSVWLVHLDDDLGFRLGNLFTFSCTAVFRHRFVASWRLSLPAKSLHRFWTGRPFHRSLWRHRRSFSKLPIIHCVRMFQWRVGDNLWINDNDVHNVEYTCYFAKHSLKRSNVIMQHGRTSAPTSEKNKWRDLKAPFFGKLIHADQKSLPTKFQSNHRCPWL